MSLDITKLRPGNKVKFLNQNGYDIEREMAAEILDIEEVYTISGFQIHRSSTDIYLEGFEQSFNSVMFKETT